MSCTHESINLNNSVRSSSFFWPDSNKQCLFWRGELLLSSLTVILKNTSHSRCRCHRFTLDLNLLTCWWVSFMFRSIWNLSWMWTEWFLLHSFQVGFEILMVSTVIPLDCGWMLSPKKVCTYPESVPLCELVHACTELCIYEGVTVSVLSFYLCCSSFSLHIPPCDCSMHVCACVGTFDQHHECRYHQIFFFFFSPPKVINFSHVSALRCHVIGPQKVD